MSLQIHEIASRIKVLREISGISLETFAHEFEITSVQLAEYESGKTDIPVGYLLKLAHRFHLDLASLLKGDEPKLHVFTVVRKGKGIHVERRKQYQYENLASNFVQKKVEPFIVTIEPKKPDFKLEYNTHAGQEFNYVLEGSVMIIIDEHEIILNQGDSVYFDSGYKHAMKAMNKQKARFLAVIV
jgi:transcriptional regulator with XRE-family HTH domain